MRIKLFITIVIIALGLSSVFVFADVGDYNAGSYVFHLYIDNKNQLVPDRDFQFIYDVNTEPFIQVSVGQFPYRGEIINLTGSIAQSFEFDVQAGKISVNAPYVADGQKVIFYDNQNQPVLTIPVSDSSFCNDDGICNADRGEDSLSCPKDCKQSLPAPPTTSPTPSTGGSSGLWSSILYILAGLGLAGLGWWFFKRRGKSDNMTLPPTPPSTPLPSGGQALPTPLTPPTQNNPV